MRRRARALKTIAAKLEARAKTLAPRLRERMQTVLRQFDLLATIRNERHASHEIRKHVAWYVKGLPHAAPFKERGQKIESPGELRALAFDYLAELEGKGLADLPPEVEAEVRRLAIAAFVCSASPELIEGVFIDGRPVLEDGRMLAWPEPEVLAAARASTARVWDAFPRSHWSGRPAVDLYPPSFADWQTDA